MPRGRSGSTRCSRGWRASSRTRGRRQRARAYVLGLLSHAERKNGWTLAEFAGDVSPDGMQRLLNFYAVGRRRGAGCGAPVRGEEPGRPGRGAGGGRDRVPEEGPDVGGVARQYTGTAGRIENAQVGVFLAYAAPDGGRALIDRELYLPETWTEDRDRCRAAGIGDEVAFATKPKLAQAMMERAVNAGVPFAWVAADEVYGQNPGLRDWLEQEHIALCDGGAVQRADHRRRGPPARGRAGRLVPGGAWQRLSCADGSKGPRLYDWALIDGQPVITGCWSAGRCT